MLFNPKLERDKDDHTFPDGISLKVNVKRDWSSNLF